MVVASGCQLVVDLDHDLFDTATLDTTAAGGMGGGGTGGVGGLGGTAGAGGSCVAADCPGTDTDCSTRVCTDGSCDVSLTGAGTTCDDDGGTVCDGDGNCVECLSNTHCSGDDVCDTDNEICVPAPCKNNIKDGDESDVDCGGSCAPCVNGKTCLTYGDCESRHCDSGNSNGGGGGASGGSGGATGGAGGGDTAGLCAPCNDDAHCQSSDYCDTASTNDCVTKLTVGAQCIGPGQCQSTFCINGYCCNNACDQTCEACNIVGQEGTCTPHTQGTDPESECNPDVCSGSNSCQCADTLKNGSETDIDCGGTVCSQCATGKNCNAGSDCISGVCGMDNKCAAPDCGDGVIQGNEQCDDGNKSNADDCPDDANNGGSCQHATCGDGFVDGQGPQTEACDGDGNGTPGETAACNSNCTVSTCGDGIKNVSDNEQCDDGDHCPDDPNKAGTCQDASCGDGFHKTVGQNLEQCDDGNQSNDDDCLSSCNLNTCGDGYVDGQAPQTEACDGDGNGTPGETAACNSNCTASSCGDGIKNASDNEQCDDGNQSNNDDCPSDTNNGGSCQHATCSDGFFNSAGPTLTESEVDCGGPCYACPAGLLLTEIVVQATTDELIEIHNPTASEITLSNVYLSDFKTYYLVTQAAATPNSTDFLVKFPAGTSIAAGAFLVVSLEPAANFQATYGALPDFDFDPNDALAPAMVPAKGAISSSAGLSNGDEMVVLFFWDGSADLVKDVDYVVYGDTSDAMNKSSIVVGSSTYLAETAEASQTAAAAPGAGASLNRCVLNEGSESQTGSNGFAGHDETSENLDARFFALSARTPGAAPTICPGTHIWSKDFGTTGQDELMAVASDGSGNVVIAGWFRNFIDFGGGALSDSGQGDLFVAKLDSSGNHLWSMKTGGSAFDGAWGLALDGSGDVYVTGIFESATIAFPNGPTLTNTGNADVFVAKLSGADGSHVWSKSASGGGYDRAEGIAVSGNNVVVGGFFESGTFNLGAALSNAGQGDIFVTQLATSNGAHDFSKSFGGTSHDQVWEVDVDAAGDIYITGTFNSSALAFGATILATAGDFDVVAAQLSGADGTSKWAKSYGGTGLDQGFGIATDGSGAVALTGHFASSSVTFGAAPDTLSNSGGEDAYVAVLQTSDGSHQWSVNASGAGNDRGEAVGYDSTGSLYVAGHFAGASLNLGSTGDALSNSVGGTQVFVARLTGAGGHVWSRSAAASSASTNKAMALSADGGVYAGGLFSSSSINFGGPGDLLNMSGVSDVFLAKLQP